MQLIEGLQREIEQLRKTNKNFLAIMKKNEIKFEAVEKVTWCRHDLDITTFHTSRLVQQPRNILAKDTCI